MDKETADKFDKVKAELTQIMRSAGYSVLMLNIEESFSSSVRRTDNPLFSIRIEKIVD